MNWEMIGSIAALAAFVYGIMRNLRKDIFDRFGMVERRLDKIDDEFKEVRNEIKEVRKEMDQGFREIRSDISEVNERISFLEAANIYTMPLEPVQPNQRSQAAKEMWKRRRQKSIEKKEE